MLICGILLILTQDIIPPNTAFNKLFLDLLRKIFVYDPNKRISAKEALKHPWFRESLIDDGTEAARLRRERAANAILEREAALREANGYR